MKRSVCLLLAFLALLLAGCDRVGTSEEDLAAYRETIEDILARPRLLMRREGGALLSATEAFALVEEEEPILRESIGAWVQVVYNVEIVRGYLPYSQDIGEVVIFENGEGGQAARVLNISYAEPDGGHAYLEYSALRDGYLIWSGRDGGAIYQFYPEAQVVQVESWIAEKENFFSSNTVIRGGFSEGQKTALAAARDGQDWSKVRGMEGILAEEVGGWTMITHE